MASSRGEKRGAWAKKGLAGGSKVARVPLVLVVRVDAVFVLDNGTSRGSRTLLSAFARRRGHSSMQRSELLHHLIVLVLLVGVDGLGMLPEVVEARKVFAAVAAKGAFSSMFSSRVSRESGTRGKARNRGPQPPTERAWPGALTG